MRALTLRSHARTTLACFRTGERMAGEPSQAPNASAEGARDASNARAAHENDDAHVAIVVSEPWRETLAPVDAPAGSSYRDPVGAYLASLGTEKSRSTAVESMRRIARLAGLGDDPQAWRRMPWTRLTFAETNMLRNAAARAYKPASARLTVTVLKGVLHHAYKLGLISAEQYERAVDLPPIKGKSARAGRELKADDIARLEAHLRRLPRVYGAMARALFAVGIGAALRREELARLTVAGVQRGELHFIGKGRKEARQPLMLWAEDTLREWLELRAKIRSKRTGERLRAPTVFVRARANGSLEDVPMTPRQVWELVVRETRAAGLEKTATHDLRRTFGTRALRELDALQVQALMRHEHLSTTQIYDRRSEEERAGALEKLGKSLAAEIKEKGK